jgi:hypothetical protein
MSMLAPSLFVRLVGSSGAVLIAASALSAFASPLTIDDLKDGAKVSAAVQRKLSFADARQMQMFVAEATTATRQRRYGPAFKAWVAAALIQPNAANLAMASETMLREIGSGTGGVNAVKRRKAALPMILKLYGSALVSEKVAPMLGGVIAGLVADHDCLTDYVEKAIVTKTCRPLRWSGAVR